jgi:predicted transcriptional regulator
MATGKVKLNVDDIIASLQDLSNSERAKLNDALIGLQSDLDLKAAIQENLSDVKNGRVSAHDAVMKEIKEKHKA